MPTNPRDLSAKPLKGGAVLEAPTSISLCLALARLVHQDIELASAAALGRCWKGPGNLRKVAYSRADLAGYGEACANALYERGYSFGDILAGGGEALKLCAAAIPDSAMVAEVQGNSEGPTEGPP